MPDNWQAQNNGVSTSFNNASADNLEDSMWRLKIQPHDNQEGVAANSSPYPDRPGEPDCIYYLRTGLCGYGSNCRFNHPAYAGRAVQYRGELPERVGQPDCQYFLKTGTCKFGATCKYHHPRDRHDTAHVLLNILGLPMRQGTLSPISSTSVLGSNIAYNSKPQGESGSSGQVQLLSTSVPHFPERPDQPECQYYMKTGSCKFGPTCKYHHPKERIAPLATSTLGPLGLPLRPGQAVCTFYTLYGICKYGPTCKYDHPLGAYFSYSMSLPALSMPDPTLFPYQRNSPMARSAETSPSKSSRLPDRKPEVSTTKHQNPDTKPPESPPQQATPTQTSPTSELPHDQSD
ncbi:PREDICTED: zinc finger CCCH domain-containing protein 57 isoform X3 [Nelumbo nucifera]|uniref:Zinc finger CCCH domain-containing protein 57 isoform X3 n=1 Tax=Nelumbo nucifera TaxID=4432 RepID=A0A1U8AUA0_NELNU|nr:PREDICTED: zinc finger CCCH domain-containing protein 57 isoform X3 [Nelumbo nucifera]